VLLNNPWVKEEITEQIRKYFELHGNENMSSKFANTDKVLLKGKSTTLNEYEAKRKAENQFLNYQTQ
jgi:hypothetical protein